MSMIATANCSIGADMSPPELYSGSRFRRAVVHFLLGRATQAVAFFALTLWLVRLLAPADYGAYMTLWGMVEMMVPLSSLGMLEAVRRFLPDLAVRGAPGAMAQFVRYMTMIRLAIMIAWAAAIYFFWPQLSAWMGFSTVQQGAGAVGVVLVVSVIGFRYASEMLECLLEQRWSQLTHALMPLGRLAGVSVLVWAEGVSLQRILWIDLTVSVMCFLLAEFFLVRRIRRSVSIGDYDPSAKEVGTFAWHMAVVNLLQAAASAGALRIIVARMLGLEAAGMFAFLQQLLSSVGRYLPANLLANLIRPMLIARHRAGEERIVGDGMALLWKTNLLIIGGCVIAMSAAGNSIVSLASGGRFLDGGILMLIMFVGLGSATQGQLVSMTMQIFSYTRQLRNFSFLTALTPLAVIVGVAWGVAGVAIGMVATSWIKNSLTLRWLGRQAGKIDLDWNGAARALALILCLAALGLWLEEHQYGILPALASTCLPYLVGLWLLKPLNQLDMDLLGRGMRRYSRLFAPFARNHP
jgi:O-antigen/teichoic acid export membrane protein